MVLTFTYLQNPQLKIYDMQEILMKYTDKYAELIIPWLLTSGLKIVFIVIGSLILNKVIITFIEKE
jgi:small conductance mechanosensitive channel